MSILSTLSRALLKNFSLSCSRSENSVRDEAFSMTRVKKQGFAFAYVFFHKLHVFFFSPRIFLALDFLVFAYSTTPTNKQQKKKSFIYIARFTTYNNFPLDVRLCSRMFSRSSCEWSRNLFFLLDMNSPLKRAITVVSTVLTASIADPPDGRLRNWPLSRMDDCCTKYNFETKRRETYK